MAITEEWLDARAKDVEALGGAFLAAFDELDTREERREAFIAVFSKLLDETDGPGPDWLVDSAVKAALGPMFDLLSERFG